MSGVSAPLALLAVLVASTAALAQAPAENAPKRLGHPVLTPPAGTAPPPAAQGAPAGGAGDSRRLGKRVLVPRPEQRAPEAPPAQPVPPAR